MKKFNSYLPLNTDFGQLIDQLFRELGVGPEIQHKLMLLLNVLKERDSETYEHSCRVSYLCVLIARLLFLDQRALFYSGLMHDIGKLLINPNVIKKNRRVY